VVAAGGGSTVSPSGVFVPQKPSWPSVTQTVSPFERMAPDLVAFNVVAPRWLSVTDAAPAVSVVAPPTEAPATEVESLPLITLTAKGSPGRAVDGPDSRSSASLPSP
jgi:hypothetical protein